MLDRALADACIVAGRKAGSCWAHCLGARALWCMPDEALANCCITDGRKDESCWAHYLGATAHWYMHDGGLIYACIIQKAERQDFLGHTAWAHELLAASGTEPLLMHASHRRQDLSRHTAWAQERSGACMTLCSCVIQMAERRE